MKINRPTEKFKLLTLVQLFGVILVMFNISLGYALLGIVLVQLYLTSKKKGVR